MCKIIQLQFSHQNMPHAGWWVRETRWWPLGHSDRSYIDHKINKLPSFFIGTARAFFFSLMRVLCYVNMFLSPIHRPACDKCEIDGFAQYGVDFGPAFRSLLCVWACVCVAIEMLCFGIVSVDKKLSCACTVLLGYSGPHWKITWKLLHFIYTCNYSNLKCIKKCAGCQMIVYC